VRGKAHWSIWSRDSTTRKRARIVMDGMDVRDASLASIRTQVAFVFQETYLFSDTVSANIAYGRPGVDSANVEAWRAAGARRQRIHRRSSRRIRDTAQRARQLASGGQKQRLAIARAIVTESARARSR